MTVVRCFSLCRHKFRKIDRWVRSDDTNINGINYFSLTHFTAGTFFDLFLAHYEEKMRYYKRVDPSVRSLSNLRNIHQRVIRKFFLDDLKPIFDRESFARRFEVNFFNGKSFLGDLTTIFGWKIFSKKFKDNFSTKHTNFDKR